MKDTSIKEFITYKDIKSIKVSLCAFVESIDKLVSITESDSEIEICGVSFSVYIIEEHEKGADILQIPLIKIKCYKVLFHFRDKLFINKELLKFKKIEDFLISFSDDEINEIMNSMPLINKYCDKINNSSLSEFAIIFRDHFVEDNIALLKGFEKLGVNPKWIFPIAKGDLTIKCERIKAYFRDRGYYDVDTLRNLFRNNDADLLQSNITIEKINEFIKNARDNGKKIMLVDDGGIISNYFFNHQHKFDCAVEVTIVGIRKLRKLAAIEIPIYDLGLSDLKQVITYREIGESVVKRIKELIPGEKIIGRQILILGFGASGKHVARIFKNMGANVGVVDINILALISAAESGYTTFKSAIEGIKSHKPFLIVGCTGEISLQYEDLILLNNGSYVTGLATKDLEAIRNFPENYTTESIPGTGYIHRLNTDKYFFQLGDGQSINLFQSESIPNRANDVFKTGILIASSELANSSKNLPGGIYLDRVNTIILNSHLYEEYYDLYFSKS